MNYSLKQIQDLEFEILKTFDSFCSDNGIRYFLFGGTLIGAVRHKDFIPWDDDLDVAMLREDYEKMLKIPPDNYPEPYCLRDSKPDGYFFDFVRGFENTQLEVPRTDSSLTRIGIDIFIIDRAFDSGLRFKLNVYRRLCIYGLARGHRKSEKELASEGRAAKSVGRFISKIGSKCDIDKLLRKYDAVSQKGRSTAYCSQTNDVPSCLQLRYQISDFSSTVPGTIREHTFPMPVGYDRILRTQYGDYMELPPEDKRQPCHYDLLLEDKNKL